MTATLDTPVTVWRGPGVYTADEISLDDYHRDVVPGGSLSSSGARALLDPGCPAQFHYDRQHPQAPKKEWDLGTAVHGIVLGAGPEIVVTDHNDWRGKEARADRDAIRADGGVPLLSQDGEEVTAMVTAVRNHPLAGPLFTGGVAEQSHYWKDEATGVICRCRPDYLKRYPGLTLAVDLKTTKDASPQAVSKAIYDYGYYQQDPFYIDGIQATTGQQARFVFVFVDKRPPHLITVRELSEADRAIGRAKNQRALRIYAECTKTGVWSDWTGPVTDIPYISLPAWAAIREAEEYLS